MFFRLLWKISSSKHVVTDVNFGKREPLTRLALSRSLKNGICQSRYAEGALYSENFCWTFRNFFVLESLYSEFAVFFSKAADDSVENIIGEYFWKSLQSGRRKALFLFRKTKKVHNEIYNIHHIYFQSASEKYFLSFQKDQNANCSHRATEALPLLVICLFN